jgi:hypothetical protein
MQQWSFEAACFTACNCDWGHPCDFNARPTDGRCIGWGAWSIVSGAFCDTPVGDVRFAFYYDSPGAIEQGNGTACVRDAAGCVWRGPGR